MPHPDRAMTAGVRPRNLPLCVMVLVLCFFSKGLGTGPRKRRPPWRSRPEPYPGSPETPSCPSGEPWSVLPQDTAPSWLTVVMGPVEPPLAGLWRVAWGRCGAWSSHSALPIECPSSPFPTPTPRQWPGLGVLSARGKGLFMSGGTGRPSGVRAGCLWHGFGTPSIQGLYRLFSVSQAAGHPRTQLCTQALLPTVNAAPASPAFHLLQDLRSHGITARAQSQKDQEEASPTGPRLHQEAPECHSYEQDPAPPADGQSPAQRRVSPEKQAVPSLGCKGLCCLRLAGPVTQRRGGDSAAHRGEASTSGPELGPWQGQAAERWLPPGGAFRAEPGASSQMSPPLSLHQISETECTCGLFVPDPDAACQGQASEVVETVRRVGPSSPSSSFPCGDETGSVRSGPPNPDCRPA